MKKYIIIGSALVMAVAFGVSYKLFVVNNSPAAVSIVKDYRNATYRIGGQDITLIDGVSMIQGMMGASDITTTRYFGNEAKGDFDGDGMADTAFILTQNNGGSGVFYFVVVALASESGIHVTQPYLLGDRIAPQTTNYRDGVLIVNYATRRADEPFSIQPSVGVSAYLKVQNGSVIPVQ